MSANSRRSARRPRRLGSRSARPRLAGAHGRRRGGRDTGRPDRAVGAAGGRERYPARRGGVPRRRATATDPTASCEVHRWRVEHGIRAGAGPRGANGAHGCGDRSRSGAARPATRCRSQDDADGVGRRRPGGRVQRADRRHPVHPRRGDQVVPGQNGSGDALLGRHGRGVLPALTGKPCRLSGRTHGLHGARMVTAVRRVRSADRMSGRRLQRGDAVVPRPRRCDTPHPDPGEGRHHRRDRRVRDVRLPAVGGRWRGPDTADPRRAAPRRLRRHRHPCGAVRRRPPVLLGGCARRAVRTTTGRWRALGAAVRRLLQRRMARRRNAVGRSHGPRRHVGVLRGHRACARDGVGPRRRDDGDHRGTPAHDGRDGCRSARRQRRGIAADLRQPSCADARRIVPSRTVVAASVWS